MPPRAGSHQYRFFLKTKEDGKFHEVELELRTTGGDCRNLVSRNLGDFFKTCGLPEKFSWAEGQYIFSPLYFFLLCLAVHRIGT